MLLPPLWWEIINNEKVAGGKRGCGGRDNILEDGLSLFSYCPLMIGFRCLHICRTFAFSSFGFLLYCKALLSFSPVVILWLDLGLCCQSQFFHFVARKFPSAKFSTNVIFFLWMGLPLVLISDLFVIGLDIWYSWDLTLFPESLFYWVSFSLFRWWEFEKDWGAISSKAVAQVESRLMVKCQRVGDLNLCQIGGRPNAKGRSQLSNKVKSSIDGGNDCMIFQHWAFTIWKIYQIYHLQMTNERVPEIETVYVLNLPYLSLPVAKPQKVPAPLKRHDIFYLAELKQ